MKYDAEVDLRNPNTSHALLVQLVGRDKRVLDVGCAGGHLGRALQVQGCRVAGVESDPEAAEAAAQVLADGVVSGDVTELDLVGHFGKERFDVVVFGDVLEHLADPVAALRDVSPLLVDTGFVVASIPNVAHGAIRLALMQGRFDYTPLGLLDATHLRFFTRGSVHQTFRDAGLQPVEMRRTTAGLFDTEVPLRREDFDEAVIEAVECDPDATTYQFVVKAVPESRAGADGDAAGPATAAHPAARCRIGIWTTLHPDDATDALVLRVTAAELARRLPGSAIRSFTASTAARPSPHDGGLPVEALGPWTVERAGALAEELDCVVVTGTLPDGAEAEQDGGRHPSRFLVEGLGSVPDVGCPLVWSAVRLPAAGSPGRGAGGDPAYRAVVDAGAAGGAAAGADAGGLDDTVVAVPDPLLLAARALRPGTLDRRLAFLRVMGWYPPDGDAVVVELHGSLLPHVEALAGALDAAVAGAGAVVLVEVPRAGDAGAQVAEALAGALAAPVRRIPGGALVDDRVAAIAGAAAFVACTAPGAALGVAYGRPTAFLDLAGDPGLSRLAALAGVLDALVTRPGELAGLPGGARFLAAPEALAKLHSKLDAHFDRVAAVADRAAAARPRPAGAGARLPPSEYVAALELAHRRMQERLDGERRAVADHLAELRRRHDALHQRHAAGGVEREALEAELRSASGEVTRLGAREDELRARLDRTEAELEALRNIKVLRALRPVRKVYARLRGQRL